MPGKERHHKYIHKYVNGATAVLFMFNITKRNSFEKVEQWINECERCDVPIKILVGNMVDLASGSDKGKPPGSGKNALTS